MLRFTAYPLSFYYLRRHLSLVFLLLVAALPSRGQSTAAITVTATYSQLPATTAIAFEEMKFGKTAGFIFTKDDGATTDATVVMPILNGGTAANGVTYAGTYYTDGAGLPVKFKYNFALNTAAVTARWQTYVDAVAKGDNISNHSHLHSRAYNAWRAVKETEMAVYDKLGVRMRTLVIPSDFAGYVATPVQMGYKFIGSSFAPTTPDGYDAEIQWNDKVTVANINPARILSSRASFDGKWMEAGQTSIRFFIDNLLAQSTNGTKIFGHAFSHGPGESEASGFKDFVDYLMNHPGNNDRVWIAGQQEMMEYYEVRNYFLTNPGRITKVVSGNTVTYTFDVTGLPSEGLLRDFCLRLPTANLTGVVVSGADTASHNLTTGLVNVYLKNRNVKSPHADTVPPQILTALASPTDSKVINLEYSKSVTQTASGFSVKGNTITSLTGSGKKWTLHLQNDWQPTQSVTYTIQTGDAVETGNPGNKVCSHMEFLVSREAVDTDSTDNIRPLHFRNYLWQNLDGVYTSAGAPDYQQTVATETILPGQEARISWKKVGTQGILLAFSTTDTYNEALGLTGINAGIMFSSGNIRLINNGVDSYNGTPDAAYYGILRRADGTIITQFSQDGVTWVDATTLSLTTTAKLYVVAALQGNPNPPSLTLPKIELLGKLAAIPLPVTLRSFTAARSAEGITVRWSTATEKNNAYFEVQRSEGGHNFYTIDTQQGQEQSSTTRYYTTLDQRPLSGVGYYRLRQLDYDGTATFSPVITVASGMELTLFPNPVRTELNLVAAGSNAHYRVLNTLGHVVLSGTTPTGTALLDVSSLPVSLYQLEVTSTSGRVIRKFIKEN